MYHGIKQDNEKSWNGLIEDADSLYRKYDCDFAKKLVLLIVGELEEQSKQ